MAIRRRYEHPTRCSRLAAFFLIAFLAANVVARAGDEAKEPEKLPDGVTAIGKEHLIAKVPNFFSFDYPFAALAGKRLWLRVSDKLFVERYPDGTESVFLIIGHAKAREMAGTVVAKVAGDVEKTQTDNDRNFQVFIPDKGNEEMAILFRHADGGQPDWVDMAWSLKKKTIIQNVE